MRAPPWLQPRARPPRPSAPPVPRSELERIWGRLHLSAFCRREAEREFEAWMRGENYVFTTPEVDASDFLTVPLS